MDNKQEAAYRICGEIPNVAPQMSPILIAVIVQVLSWLIQKCGDSLVNNFSKPNIFQRARIRHLVRRASRDKGLGRDHDNDIYNALLVSGKKATTEDIKKLLEG